MYADHPVGAFRNRGGPRNRNNRSIDRKNTAFLANRVNRLVNRLLDFPPLGGILNQIVHLGKRRIIGYETYPLERIGSGRTAAAIFAVE